MFFPFIFTPVPPYSHLLHNNTVLHREREKKRKREKKIKTRLSPVRLMSYY